MDEVQPGVSKRNKHQFVGDERDAVDGERMKQALSRGVETDRVAMRERAERS
jgi:hypothetical protein